MFLTVIAVTTLLSGCSFVGFGCSFAGKWFGGYARSNDKRNYAKMAKNSLNKKIINLYNWSY